MSGGQGVCDRCGREAYLTELYTSEGRRIGAYGRECLHLMVRARYADGLTSHRVGGKRIWVRPGGRRGA